METTPDNSCTFQGKLINLLDGANNLYIYRLNVENSRILNQQIICRKF